MRINRLEQEHTSLVVIKRDAAKDILYHEFSHEVASQLANNLINQPLANFSTLVT